MRQWQVIEPLAMRYMITADLAEVVAIERVSFDEPWTREEFQKHLRQTQVIGFVSEYPGVVAGYCVYRLHREDGGISGGIELLNMAVHPKFRRLGVGRKLLWKPLSMIKEDGCWKWFEAAVSEHALAMHLLLRESGVKAVKVIRGKGTREGDIYLFRLAVN